jgi:hypothetical protein
MRSQNNILIEVKRQWYVGILQVWFNINTCKHDRLMTITGFLLN